VALERGPLVYCAEGIDNDGAVLDLAISDEAVIAAETRPDLLGGITTLRGRITNAAGKERLLTAVPYYAWSNRGPGEMAVWLPRTRKPPP
jgi:DUF1680 family protein